MPNKANLDCYFEKLKENLLAKNYDELLVNLRFLGRLFENFNDTREKKRESGFKISFEKNTNQSENENNILLFLMPVLLAWDDLSGSLGEEKKVSQSIKYKKDVDKLDRRAIAVGLNALFFHLTSKESKVEESQKEIKILIESCKNKFSTEILKLKFQDEDEFKNNIEEIGRAIRSFQTPNKKKKFVKYVSILLAFIAALACALSTGGAIILLFPSFSILAGSVGGLIALFGFIANFRFFSQNFPNFMISALKEGSISQYVDHTGTHKQFSATYKYLLTPLAILSSFTVGFGTAALTGTAILGVFTKLLPILAIVWAPLPLPLLIAGVLAAAVGLTLWVAVLTASLEFLKKAAASNKGFKALCLNAYVKCCKWFNNLTHLKAHEKVGLVIMLLLIPAGLAGLAYYRYTAGIDLSDFIGVAGSIVMGVVAYIAQIAFTCLSINKLKNALIKPFSSDTAHEAVDQQDSKSFINSVLSNIFYAFSLLVNAVGNAVLVYDGSPKSIAGASGCCLNSLAGNMSEPDSFKGLREKRTGNIYTTFFKSIGERSDSQEETFKPTLSLNPTPLKGIRSG